MVRYQSSRRLWRRLALLLGVGLALAGSAALARADTIYTTGGTPPTFDSGFFVPIRGSGSPLGFLGWAEAFTPSSDFLFNSVTAPLSVSRGTAQINLSLTIDSGGHPGAVLESFTVTGITGTPQNFTENSATHPLLVSGTQYWITAFPGAADTRGGWFQASPSTTGTDADTSDQGVTWEVFPGNNPIEALEVTGSLVSVPEPSTLVLLGTGLVGLLGGVWRRGRLA